MKRVKLAMWICVLLSAALMRSPIKENLFRTRVTPSREEHKAIRTPTIMAYLTKG